MPNAKHQLEKEPKREKELEKDVAHTFYPRSQYGAVETTLVAAEDNRIKALRLLRELVVQNPTRAFSFECEVLTDEASAASIAPAPANADVISDDMDSMESKRDNAIWPRCLG